MIRPANNQDLSEILVIYQAAREQMKSQGNPTQWGASYPSEELLKEDMQKQQLYVMEDENGLYGVFVFAVGIDSTYLKIEGSWHLDKEYGVIHRVAGKKGKNGILTECLTFCETKINYLRVDTHKDNTKMRYLIEKQGFSYCGIIYVEDGSPRLAYDRIK
ncbi:N-acetyltransferase [Clostridiales bacterium COT073_COT-073]|nr:N-acetyltransferase [Clostridiales bacterium COT073_COT-073]